jgi:hypothetical protein
MNKVTPPPHIDINRENHSEETTALEHRPPRRVLLIKS